MESMITKYRIGRNFGVDDMGKFCNQNSSLRRKHMSSEMGLTSLKAATNGQVKRLSWCGKPRIQIHSCKWGCWNYDMAFFVLFQNTSDRSCFPDTQSLRDKGAFVFTRQRGLRDDKQDKSEVTQLTEWMMKPLTMSLIVKGYRVSHFCIWNLNTISMAWNRNTF